MLQLASQDPTCFPGYSGINVLFCVSILTIYVQFDRKCKNQTVFAHPVKWMVRTQSRVLIGQNYEDKL